jgi:hypothetical protein
MLSILSSSLAARSQAHEEPRRDREPITHAAGCCCCICVPDGGAGAARPEGWPEASPEDDRRDDLSPQDQSRLLSRGDFRRSRDARRADRDPFRQAGRQAPQENEEPIRQACRDGWRSRDIRPEADREMGVGFDRRVGSDGAQESEVGRPESDRDFRDRRVHQPDAGSGAGFFVRTRSRAARPGERRLRRRSEQAHHHGPDQHGRGRPFGASRARRLNGAWRAFSMRAPRSRTAPRRSTSAGRFETTKRFTTTSSPRRRTRASHPASIPNRFSTISTSR